MMRSLAQFIMRGPLQASAMAMLVMIPLLSQVVIALVTLRRGAGYGGFILSMSLLPLMVAMATGRSLEVFF